MVVISNSSRRASTTIEKLSSLGFNPSLFLGAITSGELTHQYLMRRDDPWFASLGTSCIHMTWSDRGAISLEGLGLQVVDNVDEAQFILAHGTEALGHPSGDARPRTLEELNKVLAQCAAKKIPMVVANPDFVTVEARALRVMPGTLAAAYEKLGGEVKWMGKPGEETKMLSLYKIYNESEARTHVMKVREALHSLFFEYVAQLRTRRGSSSMSSNVSSTSTSVSTSKGKLIPSNLSMYDDYLNTVEEHEPTKSKMDIYLEEGVYRCQDGEVASEFDALNWWKYQELKFSVLSKLARDVLAIPISTVASEATFSAGTRVLDPYHSNLSSSMVEVLICGLDWVRQLHGIKKPLMTYEEETQIDVQLRT